MTHRDSAIGGVRSSVNAAVVRLGPDCRLLVVLWAVSASACASRPPEPVGIPTGQVSCASCRMVVSDARFSAELLAPGEEPMFFDDVGCLASFLSRNASGSGAIAYVTDHRTRTWVVASRATYTRGSLDTPMGSHVMAHLDGASRDTDSDARSGRSITLAELFGATKPPDGSP